MMIKILLLMILAHVVDDFVLQPVCLSKLKQREWWENNAPEKMYAKDYIMALLMHSMSWSVMILLPGMFLCDVSDGMLFGLFCINTFIHFITDDAKANKRTTNLMKDQYIHLIQIVLTWVGIC